MCTPNRSLKWCSTCSARRLVSPNRVCNYLTLLSAVCDKRDPRRQRRQYWCLSGTARESASGSPGPPFLAGSLPFPSFFSPRTTGDANEVVALDASRCVRDVAEYMLPPPQAGELNHSRDFYVEPHLIFCEPNPASATAYTALDGSRHREPPGSPQACTARFGKSTRSSQRSSRRSS